MYLRTGNVHHSADRGRNHIVSTTISIRPFLSISWTQKTKQKYLSKKYHGWDVEHAYKAESLSGNGTRVETVASRMAQNARQIENRKTNLRPPTRHGKAPVSTQVQRKGDEMRLSSVWRETRAFLWRAACVTKYWRVFTIACAAYHYFTPKAVSPHLPFVVPFQLRGFALYQKLSNKPIRHCVD